MKYMESDDVFRLYIREWVIMHTLDAPSADDAAPLFQKAVAWIDENLRGRVRDSDIDVTMNTDLHRHFWCHIRVMKENLRGEFKTRGGAEMFASINQFDEYTVVPRNSPADHEIRNYGVTKL